MAEVPSPFNNGLQEADLKKALVLGKLVSDLDLAAPGNSDEKKSECWDGDWSCDGKRFAWSCGRRLIKIVPTQLMDEQSELNEYQAGVVTIDCRQVVTSVAFASCAAALNQLTTTSLNRLTVGYRSFHWERYELVLAVGLRNGRIRIYDVSDGKVLLELIDHSDCITKMAFSPDNSLQMISSSYDGTIKCWDMTDDGNMAHTFRVAYYLNQRNAKHKVNHTVWSPDSKRIAACGTFKTVLVFDAGSFECLQKLNGHIANVTCCDFSPDGVLLATSSADTKTFIWNSYSGEKIMSLGHQFPEPSQWFPQDTDTVIRSCRFSSSGLQVITVSSDDYIRFWDLSDDTNPVTVCKAINPLCCCMNPSGTRIAVGIASGSVSIVEVSGCGRPSLAHNCRLITNLALSKRLTKVHELAIPVELKDYLEYRSISL